MKCIFSLFSSFLHFFISSSDSIDNIVKQSFVAFVLYFFNYTFMEFS